MNKSNVDIFKALELLESEKGIPASYMADKIKKSIMIACKSNYDGNDDAIVNIDFEKKEFQVYLRKLVVEEVRRSSREITLDDARKIDPTVGIGEYVSIKLDTKQFGRIAAQTARSIIRQGIRDGEREQLIKEFKAHYHELINVKVDKIDDINGAVTLRIGKSTAVLPKNEQIPKETFKEGQYIKVYVADVKETEKGEKVIISRTKPEFLKLLLEHEIPEIRNGMIQIKSISREPGLRTKIAVSSNDENIDPIGACIGSKGSRIESVLSEIGNEKIDLIKYSDNIADFVMSALSPAKVKKVVVIDENEGVCRAYVSDDQLSLAIGNRGQNVRLAAILTGWKIDIKSENFEESNEEITENKKNEDLDEVR